MFTTSQIINILNDNDIYPEESLRRSNLPGISNISENELIYPTTSDDIFNDVRDGELRRSIWDEELEEIVSTSRQGDWPGSLMGRLLGQETTPQSLCAWYAPIHYFGHDWGIYIKEDCVMRHALQIAKFVDWRSVTLSKHQIKKELLLSAFYVFYLHEQFHHKIESLGFRFLISTNSDRYLKYKSNVYKKFYMSDDCLEEALANAESYRRLSERRYKERVSSKIRNGVRDFLRFNIPLQPPGYRNGINYLSNENFQKGLWDLQSQMKEATLIPKTPSMHWGVASDMIRSMSKISDQIYFVIPKGRTPIFPTHIDPSATTSSDKLIKALIKFYGYVQVSGGKGSHVKLKKQSSETLTIPGSSSSLTPGILKHVMNALGGHPISKLPDLLQGKLQ